MTVEEIKTKSAEELLALGEFECACGKTHSVGTKHLVVERGAIKALPRLLEELQAKRPFLLSGKNTFAAAGDKVCAALEDAGVAYGKYVFGVSPVLPTEQAVGSAAMHFDDRCDCVVAIGSGVINDIGKILAHITKLPYIIVGTAPSMDGYASATSSMEMDGLKVSLNSTAAWAIIGDLDVLCEAPMHMLLAGVGDMLAKYVSLAEWRIAHELVDEYYCPVVAALVEHALEKVMQAAPKLKERDEDAVKAVMEGMVIAGAAMKYAGLSRPASGMEHYFSHIWDMRSLAFDDAKADLHGIQCGMSTLLSLKIYDYLRTVTPDKEKALRYVASFDEKAWEDRLHGFIGSGAEAMIEGEHREGKYDREKHAARLDRILTKWDTVRQIIEQMPRYEALYQTMTELGAPTDAHELGYTDEMLRTTFTMTKDIRDKYIGSRLLWDLGLLDEAAEKL